MKLRNIFIVFMLIFSASFADNISAFANPGTGDLGRNLVFPGLFVSVTRPTGLVKTVNCANKKTGESSYFTFLGLVTMGDGGIKAAMDNGKLTKLHHMDIKNSNWFIGYTITTIASGE